MSLAALGDLENTKPLQIRKHEGSYSMRIPAIARAITNCWISLVPSKMV
jgi:hypothetical protein